MSDNDGGKAWPNHYLDESGHWSFEGGMSLRDWFAGQALAGLCANPNLMSMELFEQIAERIRGGKDFLAVADILADAMLKAREGE